ncbi:hypothetical protein [Planococcus rifietoensis]|uniref:hypothetical protein n=1 Tax=Planococcus rifietoensis TaxID=200991 RepID=UPI00384C306F
MNHEEKMERVDRLNKYLDSLRALEKERGFADEALSKTILNTQDQIEKLLFL